MICWRLPLVRCRSRVTVIETQDPIASESPHVLIYDAIVILAWSLSVREERPDDLCGVSGCHVALLECWEGCLVWRMVFGVCGEGKGLLLPMGQDWK